MFNYVEIVLSAIVIVVFAVDRFKTPPFPKDGIAPYRISRSTTTAASYYTAVSLYGAIALGVFAFLLLSPQAVDRLVATAPAIAEGIPPWARQSPPLLVALILTVLFPKIPILSSMDEWFRTKLQRWAAIPHEVRRLSAELRRAPFRVTFERTQELRDALSAKGFERADLRFEDGSAPQHLWMKLSQLMRELDGWDADAQFTSYVLTYPNEITALRFRYEALVPKAAKCFSLLRELSTDPEPTKKGGVIYAYRDDVVHEIEALLKDIIEALLKDVYDAVSHAVLLCQLTQRARVSSIIRLGFALDPEPPWRLGLFYRPVKGPRPARPEPVLLAVGAPRGATPGSSFNARFAAYVSAARASARQHLEALGEKDDRVVTDIPPDRDARWRVGAPITVRLTGEHMTITPEERAFEWNGYENLASFAVRVDADAPPVTVTLCFHVFLGPLQIAFIPLGVAIPASFTTERKPSQTETHAPSSAFASYSSKDADAVTRSLSALVHWAPTLNIFQDCLDLTPNEAYKPMLAAEIARRDVFLLFWSRNARASQWVHWEFETARVRPGMNAILPMPLEDPSLAPPPKGFEDKHLRDRFMIAGYGLKKIAEIKGGTPV